MTLYFSVLITNYLTPYNTQDRQQSKTIILLTNIHRALNGIKKLLFLTIFYLHSSIDLKSVIDFKSVFDCRLSGVHKDCLFVLYVCLSDLILYVPSTIFQLNRDRSSWVEPVLS